MKKGIMKSAHVLAKRLVSSTDSYQIALSFALKYVWSIVKSGNKALNIDEAISELTSNDSEIVSIKSWFLNNNFNSDKAYALKSASSFTVLKETEKAVKLQANTKFGIIISWFPKSVTMTEAQETEDFNSGVNYYTKVLNFAKSNGVNVRNRMKLATIKSRIQEAGLVIPS